MITRRTGKKGGGIPAISTRAPRRRLAGIARDFGVGRVLASIAGALAVVLLGMGDAAAGHRDKANAAPPDALHIGLIASDLSNPFFLQVVRCCRPPC